MISFKGRESKRGRIYKMSRNLERLYKEGKCRECRVLVTRMDFAKILGKFTKVKIQYESSSTPKTKKNIDSNSSNTNSRSKCNENGLVVTPKNTCKKQPSKAVRTTKKSKINEIIPDLRSPESEVESKKAHSLINTTTPSSNILKENNGLTNQLVKGKPYNCVKKEVSSNLKQYGIIFTMPTMANNNNHEVKTKLSLIDLLPNLNKSILPSEEWCIDYFPKNEEPKDDKVYDRIAAELEDLMYNEKPIEKLKTEIPEVKVEEFPSIMDILNDNVTENTTENSLKDSEQSSSESFKANLESSDVEAMLLGRSNVEENKESEQIPMEVDSTDVSKLIEDMDHLNNIAENKSKIVPEEAPDKEKNSTDESAEKPHSPSILDEALEKGIAEQLPSDNQQTDAVTEASAGEECNGNENNENVSDDTIKSDQLNIIEAENKTVNDTIAKPDDQNDKGIVTVPESINVTHVVFKKMLNDRCFKSVSCPKNLKYNIELEGKSVEFIGAPKYISSIEDLQVLLQIVNESELGSLYVFH